VAAVDVATAGVMAGAESPVRGEQGRLLNDVARGGSCHRASSPLTSPLLVPSAAARCRFEQSLPTYSLVLQTQHGADARVRRPRTSRSRLSCHGVRRRRRGYTRRRCAQAACVERGRRRPAARAGCGGRTAGGASGVKRGYTRAGSVVGTDSKWRRAQRTVARQWGLMRRGGWACGVAAAGAGATMRRAAGAAVVEAAVAVVVVGAGGVVAIMGGATAVAVRMGASRLRPAVNRATARTTSENQNTIAHT